jgi:hypothetical protein
LDGPYSVLEVEEEAEKDVEEKLIGDDIVERVFV